MFKYFIYMRKCLNKTALSSKIVPLTSYLFLEDSMFDNIIGMYHYYTENKRNILWRYVIALGYVHIAGIYGLYLAITEAKLITTLFVICYGTIGIIGTSAGAHRLFSHKAYEANTKLRILLMLMFTTVYEQNLQTWVLNHRTHHKFSETTADPHNPTRGLFFSHIGWLLMRKHEDVKIKGRCVDMSDIYNDPVLIFHQKYYFILIAILAFIIPTLIPWYFWSESLRVCHFYVNMTRMVYIINVIFTINSLAHHQGSRGYDKRIGPADSKIVNFCTFGDGSHNYHHVFPYDYRSTEFAYFTLGTRSIEFFAKIGWATNLKTPSVDVIVRRAIKTGDGSRQL